MAFEDDVFDMSLIAGEDMRNYQYHFVVISADLTVKRVTTGKTDTAIGILQNKPNDGEMARVRVAGVSRAIIGTATIAFGDLASSDDDGHCIACTGDLYAYNGVCAMGGAAAEKATVILVPGPKSYSTT